MAEADTPPAAVSAERTAPVVQEESHAPAILNWSSLLHLGSSSAGEYSLTEQSPLSNRLKLELAKSSNFHKSVKWSPDGTCVLTTSEDCIARLLELPPTLEVPISMRCAVRANEGETIYDSCWYPMMNSSKPETCLFATCARGHPVHLWDAFTGKLATSYTALNAVAELDGALALAFSNDGSALYTTYSQRLCVFTTARPGASPQSLPLKSVLPGLLSCIAVAPASTLLAIGSYGGRVGLLSQEGSLVASVAAQSPGVTQISFSHDGTFMYAGGRKSDKILAWDVRRLDAPLFSFHRPLSTQQRVSFALHPVSKALLTGDDEGKLRCYNTTTGDLIGSVSAHWTCINSVSIHPWLPLVALGTGTRQFALSDDEDEAASAAATPDEPIKQGEKRWREMRKQEERVQLWRIG